jgi:4-carboxymuconolactone decarboxylase
MSHVDAVLRRLTIGDPVLLAQLAERRDPVASISRLDARIESLLRIAALVALDAPETSFRSEMSCAELNGARLEEVVATLYAVAPTVGSARITSAAPRIAFVAGYDMDSALE